MKELSASPPFISRRFKLFALFLLMMTLAFWRKNNYDLQEWDEARNGVNAFEMLQTGDYINLYYGNVLDTWNAKPPLLIWLIAASYKLFGFNEFALRLPSAIAAIIFLLSVFFWIRKFASENIAVSTVLILLFSKAVFGNHLGLTGDFDMLLNAWLILSAFTFLNYIEGAGRSTILLTGIFTGLAFYTKGPAALLYMPGFIIYTIITGKLKRVLKDPFLWIALAVVLATIGSWLLLLHFHGKKAEGSFYGSENSFETMIVYDTINQFTDHRFFDPGETERSPFYFFKVIDARLNIWNYLLYIVCCVTLFRFLKNPKQLWQKLLMHRLLLFAIMVSFPIILAITCAYTKRDWYLAPAFIWIAILIATGINSLKRSVPILGYLFAVVAVTTACLQGYYLYSRPKAMHEFFSSNNFSGMRVGIADKIRQNIRLYFTWEGCEIRQIDEHETARLQNETLLVERSKMHTLAGKNYRKIGEFDEYFLISVR